MYVWTSDTSSSLREWLISGINCQLTLHVLTPLFALNAVGLAHGSGKFSQQVEADLRSKYVL